MGLAPDRPAPKVLAPDHPAPNHPKTVSYIFLKRNEQTVLCVVDQVIADLRYYWSSRDGQCARMPAAYYREHRDRVL